MKTFSKLSLFLCVLLLSTFVAQESKAQVIAPPAPDPYTYFDLDILLFEINIPQLHTDFYAAIDGYKLFLQATGWVVVETTILEYDYISPELNAKVRFKCYWYNSPPPLPPVIGF